jgi:hypothetical protein
MLGNVLPKTETFVYGEWSRSEGTEVEFRLIYRGPLHAESASNSHPTEKHAIRKEFHRQLCELWQQHPVLKRHSSDLIVKREVNGREAYFNGAGDPAAKTLVEMIGDNLQRNGYRFIPLIRGDNGLACALDVLFLRRDNPGNLVRSGGDIDNRIKVLFDALRMPNSASEIGGNLPSPGEDPFYCLLEDDRLITSVTVTTDRLLVPQDSSWQPNDVFLVILVAIKVIDIDAQHALAYLA